MAPPEGLQASEPTNMLPEFGFMISKAPLMPTKYDAASAGGCTNVMIDLF
jgi:hypothetical protein